MAYVESQLLPGEHIRYRAHLHKILFLPFYILTVFTVVFVLISIAAVDLWPAVAVLAALTIGIYAWEQIIYTTSEFAVTDRRVIIKVGWIKRRTLETMLGKVEALGVDQGLLGRLLDFGTITVTGTGGTQETFHQIATPLEFRKQLQAAAMAADERRVVGGTPSASNPDSFTRAAGQTREERECPFCAERVLVRAKVCRFCGRDLPPASSD